MTKPAKRTPVAVASSTPLLVGVAALAVSAGGAVVAGQASPAAAGEESFAYTTQASALGGASSVAVNVSDRTEAVSRDSRRDAQQDAAADREVAAAEAQAEERNAALVRLGERAEAQAKEIEENEWHLPVSNYEITATFGASSGLWSSTHTGLDFAAPSGTPIHSVANGTVTSTEYDGSYGNKTVITLEDGTEIWYCHQTTQDVSVGDTVNGGDVIGTVGSTGNSTGPHLHLEVRPGGGDPVDPFEALTVHGITP